MLESNTNAAIEVKFGVTGRRFVAAIVASICICHSVCSHVSQKCGSCASGQTNGRILRSCQWSFNTILGMNNRNC